jgi:hypothetical protein
VKIEKLRRVIESRPVWLDLEQKNFSEILSPQHVAHDSNWFDFVRPIAATKSD